MIRFGIIGCGNISETHAEAIDLIDEAILVACCDNNQIKAEQFARMHDCSFYYDYQDLLADEQVEVVIIATPHYLHGVMTKAAFKANKHVICEKPMALTVEEAHSILDARKINLEYAVCYQNRFNTSYIELKKMIDKQIFGALKGMKCELTWHRNQLYYQSTPWKGTWSEEGGGVLINQAIHTLDIISWMIELPTKIKGKIMASLLEETIEVEDAVMAVALIQERIPVVIHATNNYSSDPSPTVTFDFELAQIVLTSEQLLVNGVPQVLPDVGISNVAKTYWGTGHQKFVRAFVNKLSNKTDSNSNILASSDALASLKMVCGIYESDRKNQWVSLH
ncbi:Gfo/Idh/MocA family oxidoreductase [Enterococcus faecium]|nr:Gfo/Idh/MocA family oxidoreductase [Enterococcus faecium]EKG9126540.1 Gfo/Idh/MocA family oxidoreductase [Enterococcus faecium]